MAQLRRYWDAGGRVYGRAGACPSCDGRHVQEVQDTITARIPNGDGRQVLEASLHQKGGVRELES
jgi:hypothetical protein